MRVLAVPQGQVESCKHIIFVDDSVSWNAELEARCRQLQGRVTLVVHMASLFLSREPTNPRNIGVTLSASLQGSWVLSPEVFLGKPGPSVKYRAALNVKRTVWASPNFRNAYPTDWLVMLELIKSHQPNQWTVLSDAREWANRKALAERKNRSAEVLGLLHTDEISPHMKHCFNMKDALSFVSALDPNYGSIGLLHM